MRTETQTIEIYTYTELSEKAKEKALQDYIASIVYDWWDPIYEDVMTIASLMGITIDKIAFSGFYSQGDGARFTGHYTPVENALDKVKEHAPTDESLHTIAAEFDRKGQVDPGEEIRDIGWRNVSYESFEPCEFKGLALLYAVLKCMKDRFAFDYTKPLFPKDRSGIIVIEGGVRTLIPLSHVEGLFRGDSFYEELNEGVGDWKLRVDGPPGLAYSVVYTGHRELFGHVETGKTGLEALSKMFVTCRMGYPVLIPKSLLENGLGNEDPPYQFQSDNSDTLEGTTREPELRDYHLSWEIELSAANPKDAARIATDYQREMLSMFGVTDLETGVTTLVDLEEGTEAVKDSWNLESVLEEPVAIGVAQTLVNEVHRLNKLNHGASLHVLLKASLENIAETYELTPAIEYEWANLKR